MIIHHSHSKKDLIKFIKNNKIKINKYETLNKQSIVAKLEEFLDDNVHINGKYLEKPNQLKSLSVKDKKDLMMKTKKIMSYVKNGCNLDRTFYHNENELNCDAYEISRFCDIPSCRRATNMINETLHKDKRYKLKISDDILKELNDKKKLKSLSIPVLKVNSGSFSVLFE